jgi:hypothetical protein
VRAASGAGDAKASSAEAKPVTCVGSPLAIDVRVPPCGFTRLLSWPLPDALRESPVAALGDGRVFAASGRTLAAFALTGQSLWDAQLPESCGAPVCILVAPAGSLSLAGQSQQAARSRLFVGCRGDPAEYSLSGELLFTRDRFRDASGLAVHPRTREVCALHRIDQHSRCSSAWFFCRRACLTAHGRGSADFALVAVPIRVAHIESFAAMLLPTSQDFVGLVFRLQRFDLCRHG